MKQVKLKLFISNHLKLFFGVIFLVCSALFFAQENMQPVFQEGNNAYNEGDYNKAVHLYEQVLKMGQHSSILYYNLGNAHYRLNNVAESIFYYEKAKQLDPDNEDLIINSAFAQNMTIDAIEPLPISQLTRIEDFFLSLLSIEGWAYTSVLFAWLLAIFFAAYLWLNRSFWKRFFFTTSILSLLFLLASYSLASVKDYKNKTTQYAILFSEQLNIRSEPNDRSEILFVLHKGTKVRVTDSLQEWKKINIANGATGWIKNASLKNLN